MDLRIYEMNDYDKFCAHSAEEAVDLYEQLTGVREPIENINEITDDQLDILTVYNEDSNTKFTFREYLKTMDSPGLFCSTEC